jgi:formylmethanofuran dehydrogenase subunit E
MQFPAKETQPMSMEIYRCRTCGRMLRKDEVVDVDGAHFCEDCAAKKRRR